MTEDLLQSICIWYYIFKSYRTGSLVTKCYSGNSDSTHSWVLGILVGWFLSVIKLSYFFLSPHLTIHFLYLQILVKVTSNLPHHQMCGKLCFRVGKPPQTLISQLRSTKKENTCTGFHISLLHILTSLLKDSNNQDTRIHTSASSTSFLKDSSYWFLIRCQAGPWNKPESAQETFRKRLEVKGRFRQIPAFERLSADCRDLQGFLWPNISQGYCRNFPT